MLSANIEDYEKAQKIKASDWNDFIFCHLLENKETGGFYGNWQELKEAINEHNEDTSDDPDSWIEIPDWVFAVDKDFLTEYSLLDFMSEDWFGDQELGEDTFEAFKTEFKSEIEVIDFALKKLFEKSKSRYFAYVANYAKIIVQD